MAAGVLILFVLNKILTTNCIDDREGDVSKRENFIFWPDGVVPFYIDTRHFDKDQQLALTSALANFSFKTCLQFKPVFEEPKLDKHVLVLENPHGIRKCVINTKGHAIEEPHRLTIGFDCMSSPHIDMMIMRALGFPFEHNRASRDIYIDVLLENVDQGAIELYTKEQKLPIELRALPYDVNSVMHFEDREYSKNGHRTFIFKNPNTKQNRVGLSPTDLQKINIIYGPECKTRDRLAKIKICSSYPVNKRKKRETLLENNATDVLMQSDNKNDTNLTIGADTNNTNCTVEEEKKVSNLSLQYTENYSNVSCPLNECVDQLSSEAHNIARQSNNDKLVNELVRKMKQVRRLSIALAKRNKTSTRTRATDEEKGLAVVNLLYSLSDDAATNDESVLDLNIARGGNNGNMFRSTRMSKAETNDCESNEGNDEKGNKCKPRYTTRFIRLGRYYTRYESEFRSTRHPRGREGAAHEEKESSVRQKREVNVTSEESKTVVAVEVSTPHNASNIENTTIKVAEVARRFMDSSYNNYRGIDGGDGSIKVENYAAINLPLFGGTTVTDKKEIALRENYDKREEQELSTIKKRKQELFKLVDDFELTSVTNKFGTTGKVEIVSQTVQLSQENKDFYGERIWPDGVVYFAIENNPKYDLNKVRQKLEEVNKILKTYTCVELQEINEEDKKKADYIVLDTSADFVVGRVGGRQKFGVLELFEGGQHRQHAAMVVMGMLGFYFELARHDRDENVLVHTRHIRPDKLHHFEKLHADATLPLPYDYRSATHPPWQYWRRLGKTGISSVATYKDKDPDGKIMKSLGQNTRLLSKIDLVKINSVYGTSCFESPNNV